MENQPIEKILEPTSDRFVLFPIEYEDIWSLYKKALSSFWTAEEIDFSKDIKDWDEKLNDNEKFFIKNILAFFAASDGIVNENLALKFYNEVQVPEMRNLYATQIQMEAIHSECVTADTMILTDKGYYRIGSLVGEIVNVYNGYKYSEVLIEDKGEKDIYLVRLSNGTEIKCSDNHKWIVSGAEKRTDELTKGDYIVKHWMVNHELEMSNGFANARKHAYFSLQHNDILAYISSFFSFNVFKIFNQEKYTVPVNYRNDIKIEWIHGLLDSDYAVVDMSQGVHSLTMCSDNKKFLEDIRDLLLTLDVYSNIITYKKETYLVLNNNALKYLKGKGVVHKKLESDIISLGFPDIFYVRDIIDLKRKEKTYCFHENDNGTGLFNGILTKQCYSLMIDTYVKNKEEKMQLFKSLESNPIVTKKAEWALKWINDKNSFAERLVAFCAVEGIFFSGSFCAIFWLKSRGLMPSLTLSNQFISRDESLHCETCIAIYKKLKYKLSEKVIHQIFTEAYEIEREFITESLPVNLIGMNSNLMKQYIQFITDYWLVKLDYNKIFNVTNPFSFMDYISLENKTNFFENRVSEYSKVLDFTEDFNTEEDF